MLMKPDQKCSTIRVAQLRDRFAAVFACVLNFLLPLAIISTAHAQFQTEDIIVGDPEGTSYVGHEFWQSGGLMVWADAKTNDIWLAELDKETGDLIPSDGKGILLDTDMVPVSSTGQGPEFGFSQNGVEVFYVKCNQYGVPMIFKVNLSMSWIPRQITFGYRPRYCPYPSKDWSDPYTRLLYYCVYDPPLGKDTRWIVENTPFQEEIIPDLVFGPGTSYSGRRWVKGTRKVLVPKEVESYIQIFFYDIDTEEFEQLTFSPVDKYGAIAFRAPEFDKKILILVNMYTELGIYMKISGTWELINTLKFPSPRECVFSDEPFVYRNRSYVSAAVSRTPHGVGDIWIAAVDPDTPFYRQVSDPTRPYRVRVEPEVFVAENDAYVYYYEVKANSTSLKVWDENCVLHKCATGLSSLDLESQ